MSGAASAQNFLANKKFNPTDVNGNSTSLLTFDLFNATSGDLSSTLTDTLPTTNPAGQLWFSPADAATVTRGSALTDTCSSGAITYSNFFDSPANTKARTITITGAVVPPRGAGTTDPNCQITVPVHTGAVSSDENVTNSVPGGDATAQDASSNVYQSDPFSATLRIRAPSNPLPTTKAFSPALVTGGSASTLTITVRNNTRNPSVSLSGVAFADTLPAGLMAAGAPTFSAACGSPSTTTVAGSGQVQMSGATIAAGATCTVTVQVTAPNVSSPLVNTIAVGEVTATGGSSNTVQAQATLNVRSEIKMTKAFGNPAGTAWYTVDAPVPANLYGTTFNTSPAQAAVNQPVPVRVYFSNPTADALTGGSITDTLPGNTVLVGNSATGTCTGLPVAITGTSAITISGFEVPAASNGRPSSCYVQFYVKTTAETNPATNALSVASGASDVTFTNTTTTTFPYQATSAHLRTTGSGTGPGAGDGAVTPAKSFITANGSSYSGTPLTQAAHVNKAEQFWMRVAARNTVYDVDYENGSIVDTLPAGLKVASPLTVRVMQNPPAPYGNGATVPSGGAADGCVVPGTVSVSGKTITYSGWTLRNAAGPNNTSPRNQGCFYNILLESDDAAAPGGSDSINRVLADDVEATVVGTARTVNATGDAAARVIVRSDVDTSKSFTPNTLPMGPGAVTRLTINFVNKSNDPITGLAVSDDLTTASSAAFGSLAVADPATALNTCGGTLSAAPGATSVSLSGGTIPANSSCQLEVNVVRTGGTVGNATVTNTIAMGAVTNLQGQSNWEPVTATLAKGGSVAINVVKSFAESSALGGRAVPLTLDFAATSTSNGPQDQITLTDNLPAGMLVAQVPNLATTCQKADGTPADVTVAPDRTSFTISGFRFAAYSNGAVPHNRCSVTLSMMLTTTGNKTNAIPAGAITTDVLSTNPSQTQATLSTQPNTALQKQFSPDTVPAGQPSTLTLTITNVNTVARQDFELTDTFPAGMTVAGAASTTCGDGVVTAAMGSGSVSIAGGDVAANGSCAITVPVRAAAQGAYVNNGSNITATSYIDKTDTEGVLEVGPPPPQPPQPPTSIPTLSEWGLIVLSLMMGGFAVRRVGLQTRR